MRRCSAWCNDLHVRAARLGRGAMVAVSASSLLLTAATPRAQDWQVPEPPAVVDPAPACADGPPPVVAYSVSASCRIADIAMIGGYRPGSFALMDRVRGFEREQIARRFAGSGHEFVRQVTIELHRFSAPDAQLVCLIDMMQRHVLSARLLQPGPAIPPQDVEVRDGVLADLGRFSYFDPTAVGAGCAGDVSP